MAPRATCEQLVMCMVIWCGCALSVIIGGNQNVFTKNVEELEMEETKKNDKEIKDAEGEINGEV